MEDTPEVREAVANGGGGRNSAATIDHTEVHVDLARKPHEANNQTTINTGKSGDPGVRYSSAESGLTTVVVQKPNPDDKPKDYVVTSCMVILLCNFLWGLAGWHYGSK